MLWLASAHALPPNSDGATVLLEVRALARGNLLLHGWRLSLNWFWAVDAPFSALAYLLVGLRPALPHVVPGLWALLVFWGLRRGRFGWGWVLAVVLFAAGMTGDLMIVAYKSASSSGHCTVAAAYRPAGLSYPRLRRRWPLMIEATWST